MNYQPGSYILDEPDELNIMKEILLELESILLSDDKTKIMALNASSDLAGDKAKLEGANRILRKYVEDLLLHFNLPFEQEAIEPGIGELVSVAVETFEEIVGKRVAEFNLQNYLDHFLQELLITGLPESFKLRREGFLNKILKETVLAEGLSQTERLLRLYLLKRENLFRDMVPEISHLRAIWWVGLIVPSCPVVCSRVLTMNLPF